MCYGFVWFDFNSSKGIPDDPLTRKPSRGGRSGACQEHPVERYRRCCFNWFWMFLFILLFLVFLFLMGARMKRLFPTLPFFCPLSHSSSDNPAGDGRSFHPGAPGDGGSGPFHNRPNGGDDVNEGMAPLTRSGDDGGGSDQFSESSTTNSYQNPQPNLGNQGPGQDQNNNNNNNPGQSDTPNSRGWFGWGSGSPTNEQPHGQGQGQGQDQSRQVPNSENSKNQGASPKSTMGENDNNNNNNNDNRGWFGWGKKSSTPEPVNKDTNSGNKLDAKSKNNNNNLNSDGSLEKNFDSDGKRKGDQLRQEQEQQSSSRLKKPTSDWRPITNKKNYALCTDGAFEYRILNFPPFRGKESEHASYHILQPGLDTNVKWRFNPPGDAIIKLSQPISIDGMTLIHLNPEKHFDRDFSTTPKNLELYGTSEQRGISKGIHNPVLLGQFQFTRRKEGFQYFPVQTLSNERFSHVELRFLNSYENPEFVDVYRIEIHGKP